MGLGLPNFNFIFQSKGISAIERSARGIVAVILNDDTEGEEQNVYKMCIRDRNCDETDAGRFCEAIYRGQKGGWMRWDKEKKCTLNRAA